MDIDHDDEQISHKQQQQNQNQKQAPHERTSQPALHLTSDEVNYLIYRYVHDNCFFYRSNFVGFSYPLSFLLVRACL